MVSRVAIFFCLKFLDQLHSQGITGIVMNGVSWRCILSSVWNGLTRQNSRTEVTSTGTTCLRRKRRRRIRLTRKEVRIEKGRLLEREFQLGFEAFLVNTLIQPVKRRFCTCPSMYNASCVLSKLRVLCVDSTASKGECALFRYPMIVSVSLVTLQLLWT